MATMLIYMLKAEINVSLTTFALTLDQTYETHVS